MSPRCAGMGLHIHHNTHTHTQRTRFNSFINLLLTNTDTQRTWGPDTRATNRADRTLLICNTGKYDTHRTTRTQNIHKHCANVTDTHTHINTYTNKKNTRWPHRARGQLPEQKEGLKSLCLFSEVIDGREERKGEGRGKRREAVRKGDKVCKTTHSLLSSFLIQTLLCRHFPYYFYLLTPNHSSFDLKQQMMGKTKKKEEKTQVGRKDEVERKEARIERWGETGAGGWIFNVVCREAATWLSAK